MTKVTYEAGSEAWKDFDQKIRALITEKSLKRVCEIGGGANPLLGLDYLSAHGLEYAVLDISQQELDKTPPGYQKIIADIADRNMHVTSGFDLVFSRMLAEHITDPEVFHRNVHAMLNDGGLACHFFPTLFALPFVINLLLPESVTSSLLGVLAPRDRDQCGKFPAYYRWCFGPTEAQIKRLKALQYAVLEYKGFFGHAGYYKKIPVIRDVHAHMARFFVDHPIPYFTSYAYVILKKNSN